MLELLGAAATLVIVLALVVAAAAMLSVIVLLWLGGLATVVLRNRLRRFGTRPRPEPTPGKGPAKNQATAAPAKPAPAQARPAKRQAPGEAADSARESSAQASGARGSGARAGGARESDVRAGGERASSVLASGARGSGARAGDPRVSGAQESGARGSGGGLVGRVAGLGRAGRGLWQRMAPIVARTVTRTVPDVTRRIVGGPARRFAGWAGIAAARAGHGVSDAVERLARALRRPSAEGEEVPREAVGGGGRR